MNIEAVISRLEYLRGEITRPELHDRYLTVDQQTAIRHAETAINDFERDILPILKEAFR